MSQMPPPPPPPDPYQGQQPYSAQSYPGQPGASFPGATQALAAGWAFCKDNFWIVALLAGLASLVNLLSYVPALVSDQPNQLLASVLSLVSAFVSLVLVLALLRRALDWWDEIHGRAQRRDFSQAFSAAIQGATPRLLPWIGWNLLAGLIIGLVLGAVVVIMVAAASIELTIILGLLLLIGSLVVAVYFAFFAVAIADGPGNPFSTSLRVSKGHFWSVLGTFLLLVLFTFAAYLPLIVLIFIVGASAAAPVITFAYMVVLLTVIEAVSLGAIVTMYRSVIQR